MKKLTTYARLFVLLAAAFASSCSNKGFEDTINSADLKEAVNKTRANFDLTQGSGEFELCIQPRELLPLDPAPINPDLSTVYDDLYNLRELPINIIAVENTQGGGRFLRAQGAGNEILFAQYSNSINERFYIKILPPSSGVPYMIYSMESNTPISIWQKVANPEEKVLVAVPQDETSTWGASWDFYRGKTDGALVIQNNNVMGGGPDYWDMYYRVIGAQKEKVSLLKYTNLATQEFELRPVEEYTIQSIEFINDATATLSHQPSKILRDGFSNNGPIIQKYTLQISEEVTETSSFNEKTSVSLQVNTTFKTKVPFLVEGSISTTVTSSFEYTYGRSSTNKRMISRTYPVDIPPMYRADLSVTLFDDEIDMNYIATCRGVESGRIIKIKGVWRGVSVSQGEAALTLTPLNNRSAPQTFIFDEKNETWVPEN